MSRNRSHGFTNHVMATIPLDQKESLILRFLYHTFLGRMVLKLLIAPPISKLAGFVLSCRVSRFLIAPFIKKNRIIMERFEDKRYETFNAFFSRTLKEQPSLHESKLIAPCDGYLSVYPITSALKMDIKHSIYSLEELLQDSKLASEFDDGICLVFRLCPEHYHRYHYFDDGTILKKKTIKGQLHTVRPIALEQYPVFSRNTREYVVLETKHFQTCIQMEVGALMVGKIQNFQETGPFQRGLEKGTFLFGGSTIIIILKKDVVLIKKEFVDNTVNGLETSVSYGDILGDSKQFKKEL